MNGATADDSVKTIKSPRRKRIIISAHGNSLRALVKYIENIPDKKIEGLNIVRGMPLVYELNGDLEPIRHYYLANAEEREI